MVEEGEGPVVGASPLPHHHLLGVLEACVEGWQQPHEQEVSVSPITGGMTNDVFRCEKGRGPNRCVLLRRYGENTELFFSRDAELAALKHLASEGLCPRLLGEFEGGRVEQFVDASPFTPRHMRSRYWGTLVARKLSVLHRTDVPEVCRDPQLFSTMRRWFDCARRAAGGIGVDLPALEQRILQLESRLSRLSSPVVFSHCDLQMGNILAGSGRSRAGRGRKSRGRRNRSQQDRHQIYLIDFEYSNYSYRGYDIGNFFCEQMFDYHSATPHLADLEHFPSIEVQEAFCRGYLGRSADEEEVMSLAHEAREFALASHLTWACWGLAQANRAQEGDFNYVAYALGRIEAYDHFSGDDSC
jgi:choline/ethanolamine kinase